MFKDLYLNQSAGCLICRPYLVWWHGTPLVCFQSLNPCRPKARSPSYHSRRRLPAKWSHWLGWNELDWTTEWDVLTSSCSLGLLISSSKWECLNELERVFFYTGNIFPFQSKSKWYYFVFVFVLLNWLMYWFGCATIYCTYNLFNQVITSWNYERKSWHSWLLHISPSLHINSWSTFVFKKLCNNFLLIQLIINQFIVVRRSISCDVTVGLKPADVYLNTGKHI